MRIGSGGEIINPTTFLFMKKQSLAARINQVMARKPRKRVTKKKESTGTLPDIDLLSSGSTLVNLATTGNPNGCFVKGKYVLFVGDSTSGKTWISLNAFAEAAINPNFDDYRLIYDNVEDGALMNIAEYFGKKAADRIEPPAIGKGNTPIYSDTVEDFYYHVDDACEHGKPFIYVLDSMDSLSSDAEGAKFDEQKKASRRGKTTAGSYGDGKAKKNSANIRRVLSKLRKTGSILIIIGQTRDNLGFGFAKKIYSGGRALKFYATLELWATVKSKLKKTVRGKDTIVGTRSTVHVKKNRITGRDRQVEVLIYNSLGVDNVGSCVDYLRDSKHWKTKGTKGTSIEAVDFDFVGTRERLIAHIEKNDLEKQLISIVASVWSEIDKETAIPRKRRYE